MQLALGIKAKHNAKQDDGFAHCSRSDVLWAGACPLSHCYPMQSRSLSSSVSFLFLPNIDVRLLHVGVSIRVEKVARKQHQT